MSETVNAIEHRLSPERLKREAKDAVHETIDEVRDRFNPQHLAERAGRNMLDTVKDHPVPALIAGLSLGYLFMKAGEGSSRHRDHDYYERRRYYGGYGSGYGGTYSRPYDRSYGRDYDYRERDYDYRERDYDYQERRYYEEPAYPYTEGTAQTYEPSQYETSQDEGRSAKDRVSDAAGQAQEQAQQLGRQVRRGARRATNGLEEFVHENPLAAGALAIGVGALVGGLLPSTHMEDEMMGEARDKVVHRAQDAAQETMEHAKEAAGRVAEEAKDASRDVKEKAKSEAQGVKETAKEGARDVRDEAKQQAQDQSRSRNEPKTSRTPL